VYKSECVREYVFGQNHGVDWRCRGTDKVYLERRSATGRKPHTAHQKLHRAHLVVNHFDPDATRHAKTFIRPCAMHHVLISVLPTLSKQDFPPSHDINRIANLSPSPPASLGFRTCTIRNKQMTSEAGRWNREGKQKRGCVY
jgi:hypothetical protein